MKCNICQKPLDIFDPSVTTVQFETHDGNPVLNRLFNLCDKCAYKMFEQFIKADPMCKKCDSEEKAETD